jgi:hypothetical protein
MEMMPVTSERKAQLEEYARQRGQKPADVLDEVLAKYLEWEQEEYTEAVRSVTEAHESLKAGRTRPASDFLEELREKHGFPR